MPFDERDTHHIHLIETSPIRRRARRIDNALALEAERQGSADVVDVPVLL
jgi:hypothetical protein